MRGNFVISKIHLSFSIHPPSFQFERIQKGGPEWMDNLYFSSILKFFEPNDGKRPSILSFMTPTKHGKVFSNLKKFSYYLCSLNPMLVWDSHP